MRDLRVLSFQNKMKERAQVAKATLRRVAAEFRALSQEKTDSSRLIH